MKANKKELKNISKIGKHMNVKAYIDGKMEAEARTKPLKHIYF